MHASLFSPLQFEAQWHYCPGRKRGHGPVKTTANDARKNPPPCCSHHQITWFLQLAAQALTRLHRIQTSSARHCCPLGAIFAMRTQRFFARLCKTFPQYRTCQRPRASHTHRCCLWPTGCKVPPRSWTATIRALLSLRCPRTLATYDTLEHTLGISTSGGERKRQKKSFGLSLISNALPLGRDGFPYKVEEVSLIGDRFHGISIIFWRKSCQIFSARTKQNVQKLEVQKYIWSATYARKSSQANKCGAKSILQAKAKPVQNPNCKGKHSKIKLPTSYNIVFQSWWCDCNWRIKFEKARRQFHSKHAKLKLPTF